MPIELASPDYAAQAQDITGDELSSLRRHVSSRITAMAESPHFHDRVKLEVMRNLMVIEREIVSLMQRAALE